MKNNFLYIAFLICQLSIAQDVNNTEAVKEKSGLTFTQLHFSVPLWANPNIGEIDPDTGEKEPWILPAGLSGRAGIGFHSDQWIGVSINTGIDWKANIALVVAPLFGAVRISPLVGKDLRITSEVGYGKAFSIGRGGLVGDFKKISLGVESKEANIGLYMEICEYGFPLHDIDKVGSFSLGISILMF